ncbi:GGDEF domain-containing response regulator [Pleionea sp. CnH1-48]|uniref:two-component system response regulator n=1 Tax=Pleionea sp. CnH1-48 TaxID=2954494 RepID=UPI002097121D|nr:GGDEF domain-containing response regulator [Pleionea sp. CnH1-48]MCO7225886.1 EAL domain-containing protein [Pleionea sp. CnH1-48]
MMTKEEQLFEETDDTFLMVEDDPADAELFSSMLSRAMGDSCKVDCVGSMHQALDVLSDSHYSALILDMRLPDGDGVENIERILDCNPHIPIVVLTGVDEPKLACDSFQLGVQDYLPKADVTPKSFARAIRHAMERKDIELNLKSELERSSNKNKQLEQATKYDFLTGVANRNFFYEEVERELASAQRHHQYFAVLYFDLDGFKPVNDHYGHALGDKLLQQVTMRTQAVLRKGDLLARLGGDEFVILCRQLVEPPSAYSVAKKVYSALSAPFIIDDRHIKIGCSIGIATFPESQSLSELMRHSDIAMYEAKHKREHYIHFYTQRLDKEHTRKFDVERCLAKANVEQEFYVEFQPIFDVKTGRVVEAEALLRWCSPELGMVSPVEFIAIAESMPIIYPLTDLVIEKVATLYHKLKSDNDLLRFAINSGNRQLTHHDFVDYFVGQLDAHRLPRQCVFLEAAEHQMVENLCTTRSQILSLQKLGVSVSLDDYGTALSSISLLTLLPIEQVKLDRSLVKNIHNNQKNQAVAAGIIEIAKRLDITVVAEGVDNQSDLRTLAEMNCAMIQGFFYGAPVSAEEIIDNFVQCEPLLERQDVTQ